MIRSAAIVALTLALPAAAQTDLTVASGMTFTLTGTNAYQHVTIEAGGTLVLDGTINLTGNLTVKSNGRLTQSQGTAQTVVNAPMGTVQVEVGGSIDVSGTGLLGGYQGANAQCTGQTLNPSTFLVVNGATTYNGGSYGGAGYGGPVAYGFQAAPIHRGGGGACGSSSSYRGGNGGGALRIDAQALLIEGVIRANGAAGTTNGGGGAGGSIYLTAQTFSGATGTISAIGGSGPSSGNGGGGGRIALIVGTSTFAGSVTAVGGSGAGTGAVGSVYFKAGAGDFQVVGGYLQLGPGDTAASVTFGPAGVLRLAGNATITSPVTVSGFGAVELNTNDALDNATLGSIVDGALVVNAPLALPAGLTLNGTATLNQPVTIAGDFTVNVAGRVNHSAQNAQGVQLTATGTVDVRGSISANALGLPSNRAIDPLTSQVVTGAGQYAGGSHGGRGGGTAANPIYDSADQPVRLGSGGGIGSQGSYVGGAGGGRVRIVADVLRIDGSISADGANGVSNGGGGSGGSVWLTAGTLSGVGSISARGGNCPTTTSGGGGGGRVAIDFTTNAFTGVVNTIGGSGGVAGGAGSARLKSAGGALTVQNGTYVLDVSSTYDSVTLAGGAWLDVTGAATVTQPIIIGANTTVDLKTPDALDALTLSPNIAGRLIVDASLALPPSLNIAGRLTVNRPTSVMGDLTIALGGVLDHDPRITTSDLTVGGTLDVRGSINLNGRGHPPSSSPDPQTGMIVANVPQYAGGSYGGRGAVNGRAVYGDQDAPDELGSGGGVGSQSSYTGGAGGGRIKILAGTLRVDGTITANGNDGVGNAGGGAGGAIAITATTFTGTGTVAARGGRGPAAPGGGGGGGRVAIGYQSSTFTGVADNSGGASPAGTGEKGSVKLLSAAGALEVQNGYYDVLAGTTYASATLGPAATLDLKGAGTITAPLDIPLGAQVRVLASDGAQGVALPAIVPGALSIEAPFDWAGSHTVNGTLSVRAPVTTGALTLATGSTATLDAALSSSGDVTVAQGATVTHTAAVSAMELSSTGRLSVAMGGTIDASARGLAGGNQGTFGCSGTAVHPTTHMPVSGSGQGSGGSFAGLGFGAAPNLVYGSAADMEYLGSGGGCATSTVAGGRGGGLLRLRGATVEVNGTVLANGQASSSGGGGSGGAVLVVANRLEGSGAIRANGGAATTSSGGGGGGGRVRLERLDDAFAGVAEALGGTSPAGRAGAVGEVTKVATPTGAPKIARTANLFAAVGVPYRFSASGKVDVTGTATIHVARASGPSGFFVDDVTRRVTWVPQTAGPVQITLSATNAMGTDSYTFTVDVTATPPPPPTANIAAGAFSGARPLNVTFDGSGSTGTATLLSWSWSFGDGRAPVEGPMVTTTYGGCGGFLARLTVTDVYGQSATAAQSVQVSCNGMVPPKVAIVANRTTGDGMVTVDFSCMCTEGSAPITGYQWLSSDGFFSDLAADQHAFGPGTHTLQLTVVDANGLSSVDRVTVSVGSGGNAPPFVTVSADPSTGVAPVDVRFAADYGSPAAAITSFGWTFADGTTSMMPAASRHYDAAALEHAVFTATDEHGLTASAFLDVAITATAGARPTEILSKPRTSLFAGEAYTYNKSGVPTVRGNPPFTYALTKAPTGATIDAMTGRITWTPAAAGDEPFELKVTGTDGSATQAWTVMVVANGTGPQPAGCGCDGAGGLWLALGLVPLLRRRRKGSALLL